METNIQSLWVGGEFSKLEQLSVQSFLDHGHTYILYTYDEVKGVPEGTIIKDANNIIPSDHIFKYKDRDSYAGFANLFRYKLLLEKGGIWVDTDVVCLKPFTFKQDHLIASEFVKLKTRSSKAKPPVKITTCVLKAPAGSSIIDQCYRVAAAKDPDTLKWGETGPDLVHRLFLEREMTDCVASPHIFCPVNWWEWSRLIHGGLISQLTYKLLPLEEPYPFYTGPLIPQLQDRIKNMRRNAYACHCWNEMWRRNGVDKNGRFSSYSIYERLKKKHEIG